MARSTALAALRRRRFVMLRALIIVGAALILFVGAELFLRHVQPDGLVYQEVARSSESQPFTRVIYTVSYTAAAGDQATIDAWYSAFQTAEVIQGGRTCAEAEAYNQTLVEHRFSFTWHGIVIFSMRDDGCGEYSISSGGLVDPFSFRGLNVTPRMYPHARQPVPLLPPDPGQTPQP